MNKELTEMIFILDRSGSMAGLEDDTIGGFNAMVRKQQKEEGDAIISTILFDGVTEILHDRKDLKTMKPITDKDYYVRGNTALLDALGSTIHRIGKLQKEAPADEKPEKTLVELPDRLHVEVVVGVAEFVGPDASVAPVAATLRLGNVVVEVHHLERRVV